MPTGISKKIELAANAAIIVVALMLAVVLVKNYLLTTPGPIIQDDSRAIVGKKLTSLNIDWKQSEWTLLLVLSTACHYCTESAPFYRQVAKQHAGTRLVAVLPQSVEDGKGYLDGLGVTVDEIRQAPLNSVYVTGTPTLMLVDSEGAIRDTWIGKLPEKREDEVLSRLSGSVATKLSAQQ